jgi:flagella basal body P-ring formation protein FlgA
MRLPCSSKNVSQSLLVLAFAWIAPIAFAATPLEARVEQAAREQVLKQAKEAGLLKPSVEITVVSRGDANPCAKEIAVEPVDTRHLTRMRFAATCDAEPAWRSEFIVRGALTADVVVTTADLKASRPIDATQVALESRDVSATAEPTSDLDQVVGKSSRRALRSGQVVDRRWLLEPILVQRGATVTIVARNAGVEVNVVGEATEAGRRDQVIAVRNKATGKIIRARVIGENSVAPADLPTPATQ